MSVAGRVSEWLPVLWFLLVIGLLALLWSSGALDRLVERVTKVGGFGLSFEFTEKSARETRTSVEESLGAVRTAIQRQLAADVRATGLQEALGAIVRSTDLRDLHDYRTTIHIPDPLYANQLYQLLDYYPNGGGAGRTFSARAGIIGMAWRNLATDTWHQQSGTLQRDLMRQWGMTAAEAQQRESTDSKKLFLAMPLFDPTNTVPIGVFYLDAKSRESLGLPPAPDPATSTPEAEARAKSEADALLARIEAQISSEFQKRMAESLASLVEAAKKGSPQLVLEGQ